MRAFVTAALPLVMMGIALAIVAAHGGVKKGRNQDTHMALGAGLGLILGVALNGCGLWTDYAIGIALGPLWGMALACVFGKEQKNGDADSEQTKSGDEPRHKDE